MLGMAKPTATGATTAPGFAEPAAYACHLGRVAGHGGEATRRLMGMISLG